MINSKYLSMGMCALLVVVLLAWLSIMPRWQRPSAPQANTLAFPADPEMQAAYFKAQEGLDYFLKLAANPPDETQGFALKVLVKEEGREEAFWLYPFVASAEGMAGRLNDDPEVLLKSFKGDVVEFAREDIIDWTFDDTRLKIMHGNFTGCVELARQATDNALQFQELFGLDCKR